MTTNLEALALQLGSRRDVPLAVQLRSWRDDIRIMESAGARHRAAILVYAWNWATDPSTLRTDREAKSLRRFAGWTKRRLDRCEYRGWWESDSGRLAI